MNKLLIVLFLTLIPGKPQEDPKGYILGRDLKISNKAGTRFLSKSQISKETVLATFGEPDSIVTNFDYAEWIGNGSKFYYGGDYFLFEGYYGEGFNGHLYGLTISQGEFYFVLFDSLEIKIGDSPEALKERFPESWEKYKKYYDTHEDYFNFGLGFGYYQDGEFRKSDAFALSIKFDKKTNKVIELVDYRIP